MDPVVGGFQSLGARMLRGSELKLVQQLQDLGRLELSRASRLSVNRPNRLRHHLHRQRAQLAPSPALGTADSISEVRFTGVTFDSCERQITRKGQIKFADDPHTLKYFNLMRLL